jgi:hypothetical protein
LKSIWSDGTYQIVLSLEELLEKLAALVPPPRLNLVRYHGVLAPHAGGSKGETTPAQRRHRLAWAVLLARVFQFELSVCDRCGGQVKIVAAVTEPRSIRTYLEGIGLPPRETTHVYPHLAPFFLRAFVGTFPTWSRI